MSKEIKKVTHYIERNYSKNLSISQLAEIANLSYHNLCRRFKEETGKTVLQYIHKKRLDHAMRLLKNTGFPVYEIAHRCGYGNASKFHERFKKEFGITPKEYRRQ